jgi:hypothetical protein
MMGAFFLYKKGSDLLLDESKKIFKRKGFTPPKIFGLGEWELWLYRKQVVGDDNFFIADDGISIFCTGTVVYRSHGYKMSLNQLIDDFRENRLDQDELIGNFCLIFWDGIKVSLLTDRLNVQHIFCNEYRTCISSSFLALLAASPHSLPINRLAAYENFTTGYIMSPDTMVEGIQQVNADLKHKFQDGVSFICKESKPLSREFHINGFKDSIARQFTKLDSYFKSIDMLHCEYGGELGLSSGYDCRLLLALTRQLSHPIGVHTHHTLGVHDAEQRIARQLSEINGNDIISIPTQRMEEHLEESLEKILEENLYFFDGRCAYSVGAFSETYTTGYRKRTLGKNHLSLNGLGGEIFRNSYFTPQGFFSWSEWIERNILYPFSPEIVGQLKIFRKLKKHIHQKIENLLQLIIPDKVDLYTANSYYGLVRMPECAGNVNNAYGQISFFLTPFIEHRIIHEALKAVPYLGCNGRYQAAMVSQAAPDLSKVTSNYGFSFSRVPLAYILKCKLKSVIPFAILNKRDRLFLLCRKGKPDFLFFNKFCSQSEPIQEIQMALNDFFPESDWPKAFLHYAQRRATIFIGSFLREFSYKIQR